MRRPPSIVFQGNQTARAGRRPMPGKFVIAKEIEPTADQFVASSWLSNPPSTGARRLTVIEVTLNPGKGHNFHKHPDQEEVILVVAGTVEQWLDRENRILGPGDSAFIPPDVVHASFNAADQPATTVAIPGPRVPPTADSVSHVAHDTPRTTL